VRVRVQVRVPVQVQVRVPVRVRVRVQVRVQVQVRVRVPVPVPVRAWGAVRVPVRAAPAQMRSRRLLRRNQTSRHTLQICLRRFEFLDA